MELAQQVVPARRTDRVVVREFGAEVVIYDLESERVTHLDGATAAVWRSCSQRASVGALAATTGLDEDAVAAAVVRLDDAGLLEPDGLSRRRLLTWAAVVGTVTPLVSVAAASAAAAASVRTVTGQQTGCTPGGGQSGSNLYMSVTVAGFAAGAVSFTITYIRQNGTTNTATGALTADANGDGTSAPVLLNNARTTPQTVTIDAVQGGTTTGSALVASCA